MQGCVDKFLVKLQLSNYMQIHSAVKEKGKAVPVKGYEGP
jgi:hypothetical protein